MQVEKKIELAQGSGDLQCQALLLDIKSRIRICDPHHTSCVTSPVTQNCKGLVSQRILEITNGVMEFFPFFSATPNHSNFSLPS